MDLSKIEDYARKKNDSKLISQIKSFLYREDVRTTQGAQRIGVVCENFKFLTFEEAYRVIDPDTFQDEFEETQLHKNHIKLLNYLRIFLSLAPLILTWLALFTAASAYQDDLKRHSDDQTVAFLQLWQNGFHNTTFLTFSLTAIIDVILLLLLLSSTIVALSLEHRARQTSKKFAEDLRDVTEGLLKVVNSEGNNSLRSDADIDKIVRALRVALGGIFDQTEDVIKDALKVVKEANDRSDQLFTTQVQPLFAKFEQSVTTFHLDVNKLTKEVSTITTASTNMATASMDMTKSASAMAGSASAMAGSASALDSSVLKIDAHLVSLNQTESTMVTKIEAAQQKVADEVINAAKSMDASSGNVVGAVQRMDLTTQKVDQAAQKMDQAAQKMDQAAQKVETAGQALGIIIQQNAAQMSKELQSTLNELRRISGHRFQGRTKILDAILDLFQRP